MLKEATPLLEDLIEQIYAAFAFAPRPEADEITPHRCPECDEVRDRLAACMPRSISAGHMEWLGDSLPLLSPKALRYFLPRYLEFSLTHRDSNACELVLYHLAAEHPEGEYWIERYFQFSQPEREVLVEYLQHRANWPEFEFEKSWILRGIEFWSVPR